MNGSNSTVNSGLQIGWGSVSTYGDSTLTNWAQTATNGGGFAFKTIGSTYSNTTLATILKGSATATLTANGILNMYGSINATGYYLNGSPFTVNNLWSSGASGNIYYNSGNVGIGTTTPGYTLDVSGTFRSVSTAIFNSSTTFNSNISPKVPVTIIGGAGVLTVYPNNGTGFAETNIQIRNSGTEDGSPNKLILGCDGTISNGNAYIDTAGIKGGPGIGTPIQFRIAGTTRAELTANSILGTSNFNVTGSVTAQSFNATSDYRIKTDLTPLLPGAIDTLKPYSYTNKLTNAQDFGFVAHEVQEQFPFIVSGTKDATREDGEPILQTINYQAIIPILVAEVKAMKTELQQYRQIGLAIIIVCISIMICAILT
jgi:hypothetical protein